MRIRIHHTTQYAYDRPITSAVQVLRMTPRPNDGQHIVRWRVETDVDGRMKAGEDSLGNLTHTLYVDGPVQRLRLMVSGEVETLDTGGVLHGSIERFPPDVFLRETRLTLANEALRDYGRQVAGSTTDRLQLLHDLLAAIHRDVTFCTDATDARGSAAEAFAQRQGVCQDLAHIFIGIARFLAIPARYVSGHLVRDDGVVEQEAAHAWAEAHVDGLGWVGFDPANGACPSDSHVRVATALDYLGAAPVRGSRFGGGREEMEVRLSVTAEPGLRNQ
jgi:transglutaminase-like putative cysteine protease